MSASFIDSNIWLYALIEKQNDQDREKHIQARKIIKPNMFISEQVIAEVTVNLLKKNEYT